MSWTDTDTVKKHLFDLDLRPQAHTDVVVRIDADGKGQLPHRGIVAQSDKVKRVLQLEPTAQSGVTLSGETWVQLAYGDLLPGQVVVADDDGLAAVYQLDRDYAFDPAAGKLRRIAGGAISDGASVQVYYRRYEVMLSLIHI